MGIAIAGTAPTVSSTTGSKRYCDRVLREGGWEGTCPVGQCWREKLAPHLRWHRPSADEYPAVWQPAALCWAPVNSVADHFIKYEKESMHTGMCWHRMRKTNFLLLLQRAKRAFTFSPISLKNLFLIYGTYLHWFCILEPLNCFI